MRRSSRFLLTALVSLLVVSGCGSTVEESLTADTGPTDAATSPSTAVAEVEPSTTTAPVSSTTGADPSPTTTVPRPPLIDGPLAPDLTLGLDDETTIDLSDVYDPVVMFFWATWCHNCHEMMPSIDQMAADYEGRATVVAVARLSALHDIENDVIEYLPSGSTRWLSDEDSDISSAFRIPGNPVSLVVVGGVEADRWLGMADVTEIRDRLDSLLALYD